MKDSALKTFPDRYTYMSMRLSVFHLLDQYLPTYYAAVSRYESQRVVPLAQRVSCWHRVMKTSRDVFGYLIRFLRRPYDRHRYDCSLLSTRSALLGCN